MKGKKWIGMFLAALLAVFVLWMGLNVVVDPFGVFGDVFFDWYNYNETLNPRSAKVAYLSEHFDNFDSYIIGSSSAASYNPESLNRYTDASFYNMFHYGADTDYDRELVSYLIKNDDVKNIFLVLGLNEADLAQAASKDLTYRSHYKTSGESPVSFYFDFLFADYGYALEKISSYKKDTELPQAFDVFVSETGCYDKRTREVESIGDLQSYLDKNQNDFSYLPDSGDLENIEGCVDNVKAIREMCDAAGVDLTVVLSPVSDRQLSSFSERSIDEYYKKLASVTDYWNFSVSGVSYDPRYFYDQTHTRNNTAEMVLARIFEDSSKYIPNNFGFYCEDHMPVTVKQLKVNEAVDYTVNVPILLFHHFLEEGSGGSILSYKKFEHTLSLLKENGYNTVTFDDLIEYVKKGKKLPVNPVVITLDDGYTSNFDFVYPTLKKYDYSATIFVIGSSVGLDTYKGDAEKPIIPHFNKDQIAEMVGSGYIDIYSHTFDMHQSSVYEEKEQVRETIIPFENEPEGDYIDALNADIREQHALFESCGLPAPNVLAFPGGAYQILSNVVLDANNYDVTVTTEEARINTLVCGLHQSLTNLGRYNVTEDTTDQQILNYLKK